MLFELLNFKKYLKYVINVPIITYIYLSTINRLYIFLLIISAIISVILTFSNETTFSQLRKDKNLKKFLMTKDIPFISKMVKSGIIILINIMLPFIFLLFNWRFEVIYLVLTTINGMIFLYMILYIKHNFENARKMLFEVITQK